MQFLEVSRIIIAPLQESLFTKHNILCIATGISHLQFNHDPPLRSLSSCQASIIHFLQIVVLLVILASFSMLILPTVIRTNHYSHFIISIFVMARVSHLLPHVILIVAS